MKFWRLKIDDYNYLCDWRFAWRCCVVLYFDGLLTRRRVLRLIEERDERAIEDSDKEANDPRNELSLTEKKFASWHKLKEENDRLTTYVQVLKKELDDARRKLVASQARMSIQKSQSKVWRALADIDSFMGSVPALQQSLFSDSSSRIADDVERHVYDVSRGGRSWRAIEEQPSFGAMVYQTDAQRKGIIGNYSGIHVVDLTEKRETPARLGFADENLIRKDPTWDVTDSFLVRKGVDAEWRATGS